MNAPACTLQPWVFNQGNFKLIFKAGMQGTDNLLAALGNDLRNYCFNCSIPAHLPREAAPCSLHSHRFSGSPRVSEQDHPRTQSEVEARSA